MKAIQPTLKVIRSTYLIIHLMLEENLALKFNWQNEKWLNQWYMIQPTPDVILQTSQLIHSTKKTLKISIYIIYIVYYNV